MIVEAIIIIDPLITEKHLKKYLTEAPKYLELT